MRFESSRGRITSVVAVLAPLFAACASAPPKPADPRVVTVAGAGAAPAPPRPCDGKLAGDLEADRAEGLRILEVCIVGVQADTAEALRRVMHLRTESKLTAEDLRADLAAIYASRKVETIEAAAKSTSGGAAILILTAKERPRIAAVKLEGFTGAARGAPADAFGKVGELLDLHHVAAAEQKVTDAFVEDGWEEARVTHDVKLGPDGRATITVSLVQGTRTKVGKVSFPGARPELVAGLRKVVDLDEGSPLVTDRLERAALLVTEFYYDRGFVNVRLETPQKVRAADGVAAITFKVEEGPVFRIGTLKVKGVDAATTKEILSRLKVKSGEIFSRKKMVADLEALRAMLEERGKKSATVEPETQADPRKSVLDVVIVITGG
ncbi:MAG: hypothetical protein JST00_03315 [Deltaproteobacteria bacterium]|nr:hypothetical protein [Deltaproteobacteria bacterium]